MFSDRSKVLQPHLLSEAVSGQESRKADRAPRGLQTDRDSSPGYRRWAPPPPAAAAAPPLPPNAGSIVAELWDIRPSRMRILRLLLLLCTSMHIFACVYWRVKVTRAARPGCGPYSPSDWSGMGARTGLRSDDAHRDKVRPGRAIAGGDKVPRQSAQPPRHRHADAAPCP